MMLGRQLGSELDITSHNQDYTHKKIATQGDVFGSDQL